MNFRWTDWFGLPLDMLQAALAEFGGLDALR